MARERLSEEKIKNIKQRRQKGESYSKICQEEHVSYSTIQYHTNEDYRKGKIEYEKKASKRKVLTDAQRKKRNEYAKDYWKKRYAEDSEFREKHKARVKRNTQKRRGR